MNNAEYLHTSRYGSYYFECEILEEGLDYYIIKFYDEFDEERTITTTKERVRFGDVQ